MFYTVCVKQFTRSGQFCGVAILGCYTMIMHQHTDHLLFLIFYRSCNSSAASYSPTDYFLFPKLKMGLKGRRFQVIDDIKKESLRDLKAIPKSAYEKCF